MKYDFDQIVDRRGTAAVKLEVLPEGTPEDALLLWVADMDFPCAQPILDALHERVDRKILGYTTYDNEELKKTVLHWFKKRFEWEIDESWLFFSPGVVPALSLLVEALTEEGDGIIIQKPVYHPFTAKIEAHRRTAVNNALIPTGNTYVMDYKDLEVKFADPKNRGMILCSPHNPVGRVWTEEELRKVTDIARKYDKWIISDEIHCDLTRVGVKHHPLLKVAPDYKDRIIACTAPSKTFNLAGLQFSNIMIPNPEYQRKWCELSGKYSLQNCNPMGAAAIMAAYRQGDEWLDQVREYIDGNIRYIENFVKDNLPGARMTACEGTYLVWLDVRRYTTDYRKLEQSMIRAGLVLDEGYIFGEEGSGFERINVAAPRSIIEECMTRMKACLEHL